MMVFLRFLCLLTLIPGPGGYPATSVYAGQARVRQAVTGTKPGLADSLQFDLNKDLAEQLLSLEQLYELALISSPTIQDQKAQIDLQVETNRLVKTSLLSGVGVSAGYSAGNQSLVASGANISSTENLQISSGYRAGVQATLSLGTLLGYRTHVRQGQAAFRSATAKSEGIKISLRRELSQLYQSMLTTQKIVNIYIQEEQKSLIAFQTAELDWRNGRLDVNEYAGASSRYSEVRIKTEMARGNLMSNLYDLSALVGVDISRLKAR